MDDDDTGFVAYQKYMALKRHFTSDYDYVKYNGKVKIKRETFLKNKQRYMYATFERKHKAVMEEFIVANFVEHEDPSKLWIMDLNSDHAEEVYFAWKRRQNSLTQHFADQMGLVEDVINEMGISLLTFLTADCKLLYRMFVARKISLDTLAIMHNFKMPIIAQFDSHVDDPLWNHKTKTLLLNYAPFVKMANKDVIKVLGTIENLT